ncbi:ABC transporter substrate-binding protein [Frankia gtarii]|uniref:ABC transporter substrate-binding protein n=1 Tax=Frankia gtarii TaxID=2950102 RepID=UPI0021C03608|nr:ABC transporter substrate-binding protein [Frankia gtarii]
MIRAKSAGALLAVGLGAVLVLAACGSDSSPGNPPPPAVAAPTATSSVAAKILVIGDITGNVFTMPEVVPIVKGELRGFPNVEIETCDSKGTASGVLVCEQKAVADDVAAVINGGNLLTADQAPLAKAGIPVLGQSDTSSPDSFATASANAEFAAIGIGLANAGCTKMGIVYYDGTDFLANLVKKGIESKGGTEVARSPIALNAPDLTPAISKITGAGADCVAVSLAPTSAAQALTAIRQSGRHLTVGSVSAVFTQKLIDSLGPDLTNGLVVVDSQLNGADDNPGIAQIKAAIASQGSKDPVTSNGIITWIGARLLEAALPKVSGPVTAASLTTALNGLRDVDMLGVIHPWSSVEVDNPAYKRLFNHYGITYTVNDLKATKNGDFFDIAESTALR